MSARRRSILAVGVFAAIAAVVAAGRWYETQHSHSSRTATDAKSVIVHVTSGGDRGPGTLREALFVVAAATGPTTISVEVPEVKLESVLPALVNGHGVKLIAATAGARINAAMLGAGPVFDVSGPDTTVEGLTVSGCPAAAFLVRAAHFQLTAASVDSCDVGVDVAENATDTLLERNHFLKNRVAVRFAASGHNTTLANNEFSADKDAGVWAVRSALSAHDDPIAIHDNKFTDDRTGIVVGNIALLVERNDFINATEADVHVVGAGGIIRGNRISGGAAMGIVAENASGAIIESNELEGLTAYGVMVRGSSNTLVRANRMHNCGYGLAFVLGDKQGVSTAVENTIIEPKFNGIDVIGDSPVLRRNQVLRPHAFALHVEDFQAPDGSKVQSQPFLEGNNFGNSPISRGGVTIAATPGPTQGAR